MKYLLQSIRLVGVIAIALVIMIVFIGIGIWVGSTIGGIIGGIIGFIMMLTFLAYAADNDWA